MSTTINFFRAILLVALLTTPAWAQSPSVNVIAISGSLNANYRTNIPPDLTNAVSVLAGGGYNCWALRSDNTVVWWDASETNQQPAHMIATGIMAIARNGYSDVLTLTTNGTVQGNGVPADLNNVVAINSSGDICLALKDNGTVVAWGDNTYGECNVPPTLTNAISIAAGADFGAAVTIDGSVVAWGDSDLTNDVAYWSVTGDVISAANRCLLVEAGGTVQGYGIGPTVSIPADLSDVVAIDCGFTGDSTALALKADGTVVAWGQFAFGPWIIPLGLPVVTGISAGERLGLLLVNPNQAAQPPIILNHPISRTIGIGSSIELQVMAAGFPPISYRWFFGSTAIVGATNSVLFLFDLQSSQAGQYSIVVSNAAGATSNVTATLNILPTLGVFMVPTISITGTVGQAYNLQYVNSFGSITSWTSVATITLTNSQELYFDVSAVGSPARFYRLVQLP